MRRGALGLAVGRIDIDDARRIGSAPGSLIAGIGPELPGFRSAASRIQHRGGRLVGEEFARGLEALQQPGVQGLEQPRRAAGPVGQGRAVQIDPLAGVDLSLAVERQVIGVLGDDDMGHGRLGRQPALDQPRRRRRLHHAVLAGPTGVLGATHHQHPQLRGHDVQPLGDVLADPVHGAAAARAGLVLDIDDRLDARQVRRQRSAVGPPLGGPFGPGRR